MLKNFSESHTKYCELLIPLIKDYVNQNPTYPDIHNTLGTLYLKIHKIEDAEASFREALCLNPNYLQARINLFKSLKALGKSQEALHHGKNILAKGLPYPDVYYDVGTVCLSLHQNEEAEFYARKAQELNPSYGPAYFLMAQIQKEKGNIREALYELKKCLATNTPEELHEKATRMLYEYQSIKV
jgi:tetratricopeptide (TPR) repeat protein